MDKVAILVRNLGKCFKIDRIKKSRAMHYKIEESIKRPFLLLGKKLLGKDVNDRPEHNQHFWALRDVNFQISQGELTGIIGHNGAGKSVLLKILSRITKPTTGYAEIYGRCGSMLEVDTGFHPDLSGRENIFMSGAILGLKHRDIKKNLDEIIELSELHEFVDTPVKRYSSGMRVKLAFAIATQLKPDVLILDEILAVGDDNFRKKCISHLKKLRNSGMTILLVSHNLNMIKDICHRVLVLEKGHLIMDDSPKMIL